MCDEQTEQENQALLRQTGGLTRRRFSTLAAGAGLALCLPATVNAMRVVESEVKVATPDGEADAYFVHPAEGQHPGVLIWPDIMGLRPAFRLMGKRLAESGYAVLVVNPYYRSQLSPVVEPGATFAQEETRNLVIPLAKTLSPETQVVDARAFTAFLDAQSAVDTRRKLGTTGYCMGGPITMRTAAAVPDRVGAAASFHGGGLVTDDETSPHLLIPKMQSSYLIAIAENDDQRAPQVKGVLQESFAAAGLPAEIEVYAGAMHGWCPPDSHVYNEAQAERAWSRLLALFETALA